MDFWYALRLGGFSDLLAGFSLEDKLIIGFTIRRAGSLIAVLEMEERMLQCQDLAC